MNTLYEKLRKRVYEILYDGNPPLEFGCEVVNKNYGYKRVIHKVLEESVEYLPVEQNGYSSDFLERYENDEFTILGKPLSLQNILRTIGKEKLDEVGKILQNSVLENIIDDIDLSLPMSEQTDETLEKLLELL